LDDAHPPVVNRRIDVAPSGQGAGAITRLHAAVALCAAAGLGVDLMELALGNVLSTMFAAGPHALSAGALAWLSAAVFLGAIPGAPAGGWLARRFGYRSALSATMLLLALTSAWAALSQNMGSLMLARGLSGVALGAFPPLIIAYLTDLAPPRRRGMLVIWVSALAYLVPPAALFGLRAAMRGASPDPEAWRWAFAVGAVVCLAVGAAFLRLPESLPWLLARGRQPEAQAVAARFARSSILLAGPIVADHSPRARTRISPVAMRRRLALLALLYFLLPWASVGFPMLTGPILLSRGLSLNDSLFFVALASFGPVVGALLAGLGVDRIGRRPALVGGGVCMLMAILVFFLVPVPPAAAASVLVFGLVGALYLPVMTLFGAELFAPGDRPVATATAWSANRIGAALAPLILLPLVKQGQQGPVIGVIAGALVLGALLAGLWKPNPHDA
jgi:putative MFS transporter